MAFLANLENNSLHGPMIQISKVYINFFSVLKGWFWKCIDRSRTIAFVIRRITNVRVFYVFLFNTSDIDSEIIVWICRPLYIDRGHIQYGGPLGKKNMAQIKKKMSICFSLLYDWFWNIYRSRTTAVDIIQMRIIIGLGE